MFGGSTFVDPRDLGLDPVTYEPLASAIARGSGTGAPPENRSSSNPQQRQPSSSRAARAETRSAANLADPRRVELETGTREPLAHALAQQSARLPAAALTSTPARPGTSLPPHNPVCPAPSHIAHRPNNRDPGRGATTVTASTESKSTTTASTLTDSNSRGLGNQDSEFRSSGTGPRATQDSSSANRGESAPLLIAELIACEETLAEMKAELAALQRGNYQYISEYPGKTLNEIHSYMVASIRDQAKRIAGLKEKAQKLLSSQYGPSGPGRSRQGRDSPASRVAGPSGTSAPGSTSSASSG